MSGLKSLKILTRILKTFDGFEMYLKIIDSNKGLVAKDIYYTYL